MGLKTDFLLFMVYMLCIVRVAVARLSTLVPSCLFHSDVFQKTILPAY